MAPAGPGVPPHWAVSLRVDDVDATAALAAELGGTIVVPPVDAAGNRSAAIADPQGGVIALVAPLAG
jgi:predicted enzyme related to lactoylglutathione lyase